MENPTQVQIFWVGANYRKILGIWNFVLFFADKTKAPEHNGKGALELPQFLVAMGIG